MKKSYYPKGYFHGYTIMTRPTRKDVFCYLVPNSAPICEYEKYRITKDLALSLLEQCK